MTHHFHAVVWIDHEDARIFEFGTSGVEKHHIKGESHPGHVHHKAGTVGQGRIHEDKKFFDAVVAALKANHEVLVVGHGQPKVEFAHYVRDHVPDLHKRIMGVETMNQPTEGEIVAFARKFFDAKDRTTPQR